MIAQVDLSLVLSRKLERHLAGLAIIYPLQALLVFYNIQHIMVDDLAVSWMKYLEIRKRDLLALDDDRQIKLIYALLCGYEGGKYMLELIDALNETAIEYDPLILKDGKVSYSKFSPLAMIRETEKRIRAQAALREGLDDLKRFTVGYIYE